jgi:hypothetical protein
MLLSAFKKLCEYHQSWSRPYIGLLSNIMFKVLSILFFSWPVYVFPSVNIDSRPCNALIEEYSLKSDPVQLYEFVSKHFSIKRAIGPIDIYVRMEGLFSGFTSEARRRLLNSNISDEALNQSKHELLRYLDFIEMKGLPYIDTLRFAEAYARLRKCEISPFPCAPFDFKSISDSETSNESISAW